VFSACTTARPDLGPDGGVAGAHHVGERRVQLLRQPVLLGERRRPCLSRPELLLRRLRVGEEFIEIRGQCDVGQVFGLRVLTRLLTSCNHAGQLIGP
jgi:hypothetical protein